ncbi:MAG: DNA repair protein RecN [Anaerolineae bacterium]
MLAELTITNFAIIDRVQLQPAPGFNVMTGETGAGKSIIVDALSQLLGSRADTALIRAGADRARIEGIFVLDEAQCQVLVPVLQEYGLADEEENLDTLILVRELHSTGRSTGRVNGRAVTIGVLQEIGERLVDIHGQSEHLSLKRVKEHADILDRYAGLDAERQAVRQAVAELRHVQQELKNLRRDERELARRADLLAFQVKEIAEAELEPGEEEALTIERSRLANAEKLIVNANAAYEALYRGTGRDASAVDLLGDVARSLGNLEKIDPSLSELRQQAESLSYAVDDLARAVRSYRDGIEYNPARQQQVEERLELIAHLKRKYGDSIEEVLAFGEQAARELEQITHSEERIEELEAEEERLLQRAGELAADLSAKRHEAAGRLASVIEREVGELRMAAAQFVVQLERTEDEHGVPVDGIRYAFDATGIDQVEFLISLNPGEPPRPLAKIASGGETSRLMLALKSTLSAADATPTLIFDEIDAGIGGRVGEIVGRKLWGLTAHGMPEHQVICVTHLPQIAAFADTHYQISKIIEGRRTVTRARRLDDDGRIDELSQMLGSTTDVTRQKAREMLSETASWKSGARGAELVVEAQVQLS